MTDMTQTRITAEDYFQLPEYEENEFIQLIDGEVILPVTTPELKHQYIVGEIFVILRNVAKKKKGRAVMAAAEVYLDENNIYQPDVFYLPPDTKCDTGKRRVTGAPELVVEILSPSTAKYDRTRKYSAYEANGVQEYWIVDPLNATLEIWTQGDDGFIRQGVYDKDDSFESVVLKETINAAEIFDVD
jgi:Uma2 family endonuclease